MTYFKLSLLTPHFEKNGVRFYTEDTISEFFSQEDSYNSKQDAFLSMRDTLEQDNVTLSNSNDSFAVSEDGSYFVAQPDINNRKNTFCYTYNEKLSKSLNGQKSLSFSLDRFLMVENEWKENPFARLISIGTQLLLIDGFGNEYIFTIKNIKYSFKEINTTYDVTCDDSFTYQTIRQNSGYTLENDASSSDFIGALNIDEWTQQYIIKDCHIFYSYLPLEVGLYETKNKEIFTFRYGDDLYNVQRILKEPYRPALKDSNGKVLEERDGIYFETFPFSCSGSNANAALIALGESLGLQLKTFEHAKYQGTNRQNVFDCYFWFEPQKNDKRLGLTYSPRDSIQSFGLSHAGDSLTTVLNVEGPEYDEELITLLPTPPGIFLDLFNSKEWQDSSFAPGYFSSYCSGRSFSTIEGNLTPTVINNQYFTFEDFTPPQLFNKVSFRNNDGQTSFQEENAQEERGEVNAITDKLYLEIVTVYNEGAEPVIFKVYENEEIPFFKKGISTTYSLKWDGYDEEGKELYNASSATIVLYFYRNVTVEEQEFAEMADKCPWLENKIIDFSYFLNNGVISKDEYNSLMNLLQNDLRIVNGQLMFYAQAYYSALHERTKNLAQLVNQLDLLGAECEASIITPLVSRGSTDALNIDEFKKMYDDTMSTTVDPDKKIAILDYDDIVTDYLNKYINSDQRFLKNLYNFSNYFYTTNSFSSSELYPYNLTIEADFDPSPEGLVWEDDKATSIVNWYSFDRTNYELVGSNFKYYIGYEEDGQEDDTISNYGRPLVTLFKKNLQDGYMYNMSNEIVYNNPDNYGQFYILDEDKKNQLHYIEENEKYDEDRDYFLIRLKIAIRDTTINGRISNPSQQHLGEVIFINHFDIDNNIDYTTYINESNLYITISKIVEDQTVNEYYKPAVEDIKFISWEQDSNGFYYAYSEPIRVEKIETPLQEQCFFEFYKASLSELNKTYSNIGNYFIKEKTYYTPIETSYDENNYLNDIEYHNAYVEMVKFATKKLLYRCTEEQNKWDNNDDLSAAESVVTEVTSEDYMTYLKNLPLDTIYVKTNKIKINSKTEEYEVLNKQNKNIEEFKIGWNKYLNNELKNIEERTGNPLAYKIYQPLSFVNWENRKSFYRNVTPYVGKAMGMTVIGAVLAIGPLIAFAANEWSLYWNTYFPGTDTESKHDFYGDSHVESIEIDDLYRTWFRWHEVNGNLKPYYIFFKTSKSYSEYRSVYWKNPFSHFIYEITINPNTYVIESKTANVERHPDLRALAGWWTAIGGSNYKLVPWFYDVYWNKLGFTSSIIEGFFRTKGDKELVGDLYLQNPHFLRPVRYNERLYRGRIYKAFIIGNNLSENDNIIVPSKMSNFRAFLENNNKINSIWYYPIYQQLIPIDLSQTDFSSGEITLSSLGISTVVPDIYEQSYDGKTVYFSIFEEVDYNLKPVSDIDYTGAEKYYDSNGIEITPFKQDDFTKNAFYAPSFEESLSHPTEFNKDKMYYADPHGEKRAYTIYQIKNSKSLKWQYGYLNSNNYEWDAFNSNLPKYSVPIVKSEIQLLWTKEGGVPKYVVKSINSSFLPIYQDLEFVWNGSEANTTATIGEDIVQFHCSYGNPTILSNLTNGDFWYKYHDDLLHPLLQQYAAAVECKLTEYWNAAYTNSKYCNYFIPETWTAVGKLTNNYFEDRILLKNPDRDQVSLNIEYVPNIKIYADGQKTVLKKYYYKYYSSTPAAEDLANTDDQETIQRILRKNVSIKAIFDDLENISLDNVICTEQGNTTYYYIENGGVTWKEFIRQTTKMCLDYFSGLYKMSLIKIIKSYKSLPMTEYYRLKKAHDSIWSSKLFQRFGFLILENNYKDTLATTSKELYQAAANAFRDYSNPERQYNLTLIDVASLKGYHGQDLRIGDAIRIDAQEYYNEYDQIYNSLSQYLFITDINYNLRNATDISVTVNAIKYQDKLIQKLVKLIK